VRKITLIYIFQVLTVDDDADEMKGILRPAPLIRVKDIKEP